MQTPLGALGFLEEIGEGFELLAVVAIKEEHVVPNRRLEEVMDVFVEGDEDLRTADIIAFGILNDFSFFD